MKLLVIWEKFRNFSVRFTQPHKHNRVQRYLFPVILILFVYILKILLSTIIFRGLPFLLSTFIVVLSSWYGGIGPGILATILTAILSNFLFLEPGLSFSGLENALTTTIFLIQGLFISIISEAKRNADLQKDSFISFASHELKNPLTVIKSYNTLLGRSLKGKNSLKMKGFIARIDSQVDKITNLINDLLDVTKIASGKLILNKETLAIYSMLQDIIRDQQLLSPTHKIKFYGKSYKKIYADRIRISEVFINIINNAVKYSPGRRSIIVSITGKRNSVVVSVQDFGIGLSEQEKEKIFEQFYRAPGTKVEGLGLGLYIAQQIVILHQGKIWVESKLNKGSIFYVELPIYTNNILRR